MARRIRCTGTGSHYAIEIALGICTLADFKLWRIQARNFTDYCRRENRWWRDFGMTVWLSADGQARGITRLGSLTMSEVVSAFDSRWATDLRAIEPTDLRGEILAALDPEVIAAPMSSRGRYQHVKFAICPQRPRARTLPLPVSRPPTVCIEPMPILFI